MRRKLIATLITSFAVALAAPPVSAFEAPTANDVNLGSGISYYLLEDGSLGMDWKAADGQDINTWNGYINERVWDSGGTTIGSYAITPSGIEHSRYVYSPTFPDGGMSGLVMMFYGKQSAAHPEALQVASSGRVALRGGGEMLIENVPLTAASVSTVEFMYLTTPSDAPEYADVLAAWLATQPAVDATSAPSAAPPTVHYSFGMPADGCPDGWGASWQQWVNNGTGGDVCVFSSEWTGRYAESYDSVMSFLAG